MIICFLHIHSSSSSHWNFFMQTMNESSSLLASITLLNSLYHILSIQFVIIESRVGFHHIFLNFLLSHILDKTFFLWTLFATLGWLNWWLKITLFGAKRLKIIFRQVVFVILTRLENLLPMNCSKVQLYVTLFENHSKCRISSILAFSTNFCPFKTDLSGNTVWPQASGFQKLAKMHHFLHF